MAQYKSCFDTSDLVILGGVWKPGGLREPQWSTSSQNSRSMEPRLQWGGTQLYEGEVWGWISGSFQWFQLLWWRRDQVHWGQTLSSDFSAASWTLFTCYLVRVPDQVLLLCCIIIFFITLLSYLYHFVLMCNVSLQRELFFKLEDNRWNTLWMYSSST